jgi:hypothetical protein
MSNIKTHFGIELEICIRINPECINEVFETPVYKLDYVQTFEYYLKHILYPNAIKMPELLNTYPVVCYKETDDTAYYYNLRGLFNEDGTIKKIEIPTTNEQIAKYQIPIFTWDFSVKCGDTPEDNRRFLDMIDNNKSTSGHMELNESMHLEMISPVLTIAGEPTREKINEVLRPMLIFFGLNRPECFISNYTSGFHVNISVEESGKILEITKPPLFQSIIKQFIGYEKEKYDVVRSRKPRNDPNYMSRFAIPVSKRFPPSNVKPSYYNILIPDQFKIRQSDIKIKNGEIIEFRIFQSESDIGLLETYVNDAIQVVHKGITTVNNTMNKNKYNNNIRALLVGGRSRRNRLYKRRKTFRR